ncbi:hypothetical protein QNI16_07345 [Cytophagaceae bacterium YF14B1]|uniref:Uncharacterized protein n=1 Tax=Xanthocytophaga flava TaxID=3048013 RepID=A0AAE3QP50_9BACT|nr:hypothetical protein [Xanthocytophaga flavus]MDJ1480294.1 hypothetical protein [Xanthocytophaga flavus]
MIGFKIGDEFLDLEPSASIGIEWYNPLFVKDDATPGLLTYPITAPYTRTNQRLLGNPESLSLAEPPQRDFPCQFYINRILWKVGILKYRGFNGSQYTLNFQSDAGDFSTLVKDVSMQAVNYKSGILSATVKTLDDEYALFPIRNSLFFQEDTVVDGFAGYVNLYNNGAFTGPITPFPYLKFILSEIVRNYGYSLTGAWLNEDYVKRLVIYNNYQPSYPGQAAGAAPNGALNYQKHVPDVTITTFLNALRQLFCLAYIVNANNKTIQIVRLKDVINDTSFIDWTDKSERTFKEDVADRIGYTLKQTVETEDELNKSLATDWAEYKYGAGGELVTTEMSTLHMVRVPQSFRNWLVPATEQVGSSPFYGTGESNKFTPRLLMYAGLKNDSMSTPYPLGSAVNEVYSGAPFTDRSLQYAGQYGLYEKNWKEWIAFLDKTRTVQYSVQLSMSDLLTLDPTRKVIIDKVKYFYDKIKFNVSMKEGIGKATIDLKKVTV